MEVVDISQYKGPWFHSEKQRVSIPNRKIGIGVSITGELSGQDFEFSLRPFTVI